jgi:site-specific recombinase XerD
MAALTGIAQITMEELINRFAFCNDAEGKSENTIKWYSEILRAYTKYLKLNHKPLDASVIDLENARAYVLHLRHRKKFDGHPSTPVQDATLSAQTIRGHARTLKVFSSWLFREKYTEENALKDLKLPKAAVKTVVPLNADEIATIIGCLDKKSAIGFRNYCIFITSLDNGSREGELAGMLISRTNLKPQGYIKVTGKGNRERIVPIGETVRMALLCYIDSFRPHPATEAASDSLFLSKDGKPITANTIKLVFSRLKEKSGVKRLHCHLCRHTFAINYLLNGGDAFSLKEILGHSSMEMVNQYLHFTSAQIALQHSKFSPVDHLRI